MKKYYRVMLGRGSAFAQEGFSGNFVGADFEIKQDLTNEASDGFNRKFVPIYLSNHPDKSRVAAGLACGALWTISKGLQNGDLVLCPDGDRHYHIGEVVGNYFYQPGDVLPHRRPVHWLSQTIDRSDMSEALKRSTGSIGTISTITVHSEEIERLLGVSTTPRLISTDETVEDASAFAMEKHLEDFLVDNWSQTELGRNYTIYEEEDEQVGQQYPTDTGPIDILAISNDKKKILVVELKKGRASDMVVGQILRYMGYVQEELAEEGQSVEGIIIALEDDQKIRRALSMTPSIRFYRYQVSFKLVQA